MMQNIKRQQMSLMKESSTYVILYILNSGIRCNCNPDLLAFMKLKHYNLIKCPIVDMLS